MADADPIRFLSADNVRAIHRDVIETYGGNTAPADEPLLLSAVNQPQSGSGDEYFHSFPFGMADAYLYHLTRGHAFGDGNKRVGFASALVFLTANGYRLEATEEAAYDLTIAVAEGRCEKPAVEAFLRDNSVPITPQ